MATKTKKPRACKPAARKPPTNGKTAAGEMDTNRARKLLVAESECNHKACLTKIQAALDEHGLSLAADTNAFIDRSGFVRFSSTVILIPAQGELDG